MCLRVNILKQFVPILAFEYGWYNLSLKHKDGQSVILSPHVNTWSYLRV